MNYLIKYLLNVLLALSAGLFGISGTANATLVGDQVIIEYFFGGAVSGTTTVTVVDPGAELVGPNPPPSGFDLFAGEFLDITGNSITGHFVGGFNAADTRFSFLDLDWVNGPGIITGLTLLTNIPGLTPTDISFGNDFVVLNISNDTDAGDFTIQLQTSTVPEPNTLILLAFGLIGFGFRYLDQTVGKICRADLK